MKKNGFVFVETIIAIVILTSALLLLYTSFNKILQLEKTRIYYDDINYIYRSWFIKNELDDLNIFAALKEFNNDQNKHFVTIGIEYQDLFTGYEKEKNFFSSLLEDYEVNQMIIVKENKIDNLNSCKLESDDANCNLLYTNLSDEMINYLKTIYVDVSCTYILVVEYRTCGTDDTNCKNYYSWVSV